ncbi:AI-2E family transporter [Paenibacillus sp. JNUCC32]|uniref:AI-2E family transporter n=1 Tax=Paenibacillus sp. JNUCC32 TaxID=2777984 RepID=UPI00178803D9|nr:AI-2E family transporter [Paenibacillus sp. JNUCC-32]QOT10007.1 AI-2E family transporter [Paenibacillus sp. JNUCC-32]
MLKMNKFFKLCLAVILVLTIIYLGSLVDFIFRPVLSFFSIILVPLMLSGFFYYLLRPLVDLLEKRKLNRSLAILLLYVVFAGILTGFILGVWPSLRDQIVALVQNAPALFAKLGEQLQELENNGFFQDIFPKNANPLTQLTDYLNQGFTFLTNYIMNLFSFVSNFAIVLFTFPILLYYMLKEGGKFGEMVVSFLPDRFKNEGASVLDEINNALRGFIVGRVLVNLALGVLMYIGFLIIGLPYALLLTVVAVIANFIPFIGAILSAIPILIIGFIQSPGTAIWSLVVILAAQQIQDNLIGPYIFGKQLAIHPITIIILVLVGQDLGGIIGILLIVPIYMIIKIIVTRVYQLFFKEKWQKA